MLIISPVPTPLIAELNDLSDIFIASMSVAIPLNAVEKDITSSPKSIGIVLKDLS